mmetsp:Transcript_30573/g.91671  ORF Transcript_30573/g.91671 Transcript_30573/m.91671 type:complete len:718 (-) Transcript_30573:746-2899(-)
MRDVLFRAGRTRGLRELSTISEQMEASFNDQKTRFATFVETQRSGEYDGQIRELAKTADGRTSQRLLVRVNDVRQFDSKLAALLLQQPLRCLAPWTEVVTERIQQHKGNLTREETNTLASRTHIGFVGAFGSHHVSPRELRSRQLGKMVCVEGVVTRCSAARPKVVRSVHWCAATQLHTTREYRDSTALELDMATGDLDATTGKNTPRAAQTVSYPQSDADGNILQTEFGLSVYKDHQCVTIQEPPESAPLGQLPRSVDVFLNDDLVDIVKPGDRVKCAGIYRALTHNSLTSSGIFRTIILANSLASAGHEDTTASLTTKDVVNIRNIAKRFEGDSHTAAAQPGFGCTLRALGIAFAPSICGHESIKHALILQLVGGAERNLESGSRLRGDINVLLVGDPSTAKSQLLRAAMRVAPLAVCTTGRGSSGVGLTAAVTHDSETGDRRLEAGAVVLADRGLVCIDEFDKMSTGDRVAIHEVMEQQTVTLAKAGIHASLNARCAVLAAANPVYGQYDTDRRPQENVGLPDSLLSRFDLLFIVLDNIDIDSDSHIAQHVLTSHQYRFCGPSIASGFEEASPNLNSSRRGRGPVEAQSLQEDESSSVWQMEDPLKRIPTGNKGLSSTCDVHSLPPREALLHSEFVRKYITFAKHNIDPEMGEEARESIANAYADLRTKADDRTLPVTARCLESLIRIATAHAKVRLSALVDGRDCQKALKFLS